MPMKNKGRKTYRSMQGKVVDLDLLIKRNELTPAVGNAKVNARGDELGPGGKIVKKREEIIQEYYNSAPVAHESKNLFLQNLLLKLKQKSLLQKKQHLLKL
jgi:hypothetical protein